MLTAIHRREYLMPAIQREFVWGVDQILKLIDSLMRGYPVGSLLLWDVKPETAQSYTFYEFLTNYHERDNPYAEKATVPSGSGTTAVYRRSFGKRVWVDPVTLAGLSESVCGLIG